MLLLRLCNSEKGNGFSKPCQLSSQLAEFMSCNELPRTEVVKRMWAYIKEHDLQNPKDRREIICDAALEKVLKRKKVTMFQLNKVLSPVSTSVFISISITITIMVFLLWYILVSELYLLFVPITFYS